MASPNFLPLVHSLFQLAVSLFKTSYPFRYLRRAFPHKMFPACMKQYQVILRFSSLPRLLAHRRLAGTYVATVLVGMREQVTGDHVMGLIMVLFAALNLALVIVVLKHVWPD